MTEMPPVLPANCKYLGYSSITKKHYIRHMPSGNVYRGAGITEADWRFESTDAAWPQTKRIAKVSTRTTSRVSIHWTQRTQIKRGALRAYVKRRYGSAGFTNGGTIKQSILYALIRDPEVTMTTKRRAQLALNLRGLKVNKRRHKPRR